jgi:anti-anti-sigma factor
MTVDLYDGVTIAGPKGRLDTAGAGPFADQLAQQIRSGARILLIDLRQVLYVSSAGIRALLMTARLVDQHQGKFVLCGISPEIMRVFALGGLNTVFTICPTREDGVRTARGN